MAITMPKINRSPSRPLPSQRREHKRTLDDDIVDAVKRATTKPEPERERRKPPEPFHSPVGPGSTE